ncbi:PREDICTED: transmembrane protein 218-like [Priapulus caudatus]|uniref:Transmembrane protein 218 n=1 Tax=Priapulus caudatus TaxID=37621 RepID=A0ABM1EQU8_PRICU|nr:PREDICTED: transmembrane protein 218-like [Priapulus caudatus]
MAEESIRILGVGVGVIIIGALWVMCLFLCIFCTAVTGGARNSGFITFAIALAVTLFLVFLPRQPLAPPPELDMTIYDGLFYWRLAILGFLSISLIVGMVGVLKHYLAEPIYAKALKTHRS